MATSGLDSKAQLLHVTDIVALIGQTVQLKRRGKDFIGLCPFHQEKTPSFHVSPDRQFFYCYGCKAGGNAIDFVMQRDRIEFKQALQVLADTVGFKLPSFNGTKTSTSERQQLLEANRLAGDYFQTLLTSKQGTAAYKYLQQRGFSDETIRQFHIGFALDSWDGLLTSKLGRKFSPELLMRAGLLKQRQNGTGYYDTFRNRIMFPIRDEQGRTIAFGGRVMPGSDDPAKYLNSPETDIFSKSRSLFGLDVAKKSCVETRTVILTEGYADQIMAQQFGIQNVVAVLGTALTQQHVSLLRRYADRIVLLFDADTAGELAAQRALELLLTQSIEIAIASMPDRMDPDEFLLAHGAEAFKKVIDQANDALSFQWKLLQRRYAQAGNDLTQQQRIVEEYLKILATVRGSGTVDSIRWGAILARVSRLTGIPATELNRQFRKDVRSIQSASSKAAQPDTMNRTIAPPSHWTAQDRSERWILGILLVRPELWHAVQTHISVEDFSDPLRRELAQRYWQHQRDEGLPTLNEFISELGDEQLLSLAVDLVQEVDKWPDPAQLLDDAVQHLQQERRRFEDRKVVSQPRTDDGEEIELLRRLQENARTPDLRRVLRA